jgi:DNA-binding MarR family transcriptional regulator
MSLTTMHTAIKFLAALREIDPYLPTQTAECLLTVALQPGLSMAQLAERTGLAQSSCSRNVSALSKWHRMGKEGYDLVEAVDDPRERRRKIIFLTTKGKMLVQTVLQTIEPGFQLVSPTAQEGLTRIYAV